MDMPSPWNTSTFTITTANGTLPTTKRFQDMAPSKVTFSFTHYTYVDYGVPTTQVPVDPNSNTFSVAINFISSTGGNGTLPPVTVTVPKVSLSPSNLQYVSFFFIFNFSNFLSCVFYIR